MISIIDRYIGKIVISTSLISMSILAGLSGLIRFVEQIRSIGRGTYSLLDVLAFVLLSVPRDIETFFPMAALLGGLIGMGMLASNSELVVMMAAGRSKLNLIGSVMKASVVMMVLVLVLGEWVAPKLESQARQLRAQAISGGALLSAPNGIWAKDGSSFIHIGELEDTGILNRVSIYQFEERKLEQVIHGERAAYVDSDWMLSNVQHTQMGSEEIINQQLPSWRWKSGLTPDKLGIVIVRPESLSISGLNSYVNYLRSNQQSASRYELAFWRKVLVPLTVAVMLLVALSFIFGPLRSVTMGARVLLGVITGFVFHMTNEVFGPISQVYAIPPLLGAIIPSLLFAAGALYILLRNKT
ncbi:LPS export ABC transporter permease LptG [Aliidiomarina quisquiliarum]|uniref:LPS export ABC transporter permease LptG n=1 Tax=Aliidiomarina quisquiliarum TaxID=2938947 RepID=UPI00208F1B8C|nr:LPS export ABC transporter permease LptG [Aliidiomarina quisquiliarum]MCO4321888.1 LPS export ABC transporter permease LptG [Aliidiomarina quisquiliarum]